ncbi:MAG: hypothetical protein IJA44_06170 [Clostridia bacterium]|nr:hypothetical protein [Clostridia bacterium]
MNNELFEKYKNEMLKMYNSVHKPQAVPVVAEPEPTPVAPPPTDQTGKLLGVITSFNSLYPVENAKVTVFTGEYENMTVIDTDLTDRSGKTKVFSLPTPDKNLSMAPDLSETPYAVYNMLVESDGFLKNIHLNIPVFSGITSVQRSDLIIDADQTGNEPQIFDEGQKYNL